MNDSIFLTLVALTLTLAGCGGATNTVGDEHQDPAGTGARSDAIPAPTATTTPTPTPTPVPATPAPPAPPAPPSGCNAVLSDGPMITVNMVAAEAPLAVGGAIANGTYRLAEASLYTGTGGANGSLPVSLNTTVVISGGTANAVTQQSGATVQTRVSQTFVTSGNAVTFTQTCPTPRVSTSEFSAGGDLVLFLPNDAGQIAAYTYRR